MMYIALLAVLFMGVFQAGGISRTWEINDSTERIEFLTCADTLFII